jgi:hypothetical protein
MRSVTTERVVDTDKDLGITTFKIPVDQPPPVLTPEEIEAQAAEQHKQSLQREHFHAFRTLVPEGSCLRVSPEAPAGLEEAEAQARERLKPFDNLVDAYRASEPVRRLVCLRSALAAAEDAHKKGEDAQRKAKEAHDTALTSGTGTAVYDTRKALAKAEAHAEQVRGFVLEYRSEIPEAEEAARKDWRTRLDEAAAVLRGAVAKERDELLLAISAEISKSIPALATVNRTLRLLESRTLLSSHPAPPAGV